MHWLLLVQLFQSVGNQLKQNKWHLQWNSNRTAICKERLHVILLIFVELSAEKYLIVLKFKIWNKLNREKDVMNKRCIKINWNLWSNSLAVVNFFSVCHSTNKSTYIMDELYKCVWSVSSLPYLTNLIDSFFLNKLC